MPTKVRLNNNDDKDLALRLEFSIMVKGELKYIIWAITANIRLWLKKYTKLKINRLWIKSIAGETNHSYFLINSLGKAANKNLKPGG